MLAIDTNVVVRFLTGDDPDQSPRARALIEGEKVLLLTTVALETEWVLRSGYELERLEVLAALKAFAGLESVTAQEPERLSAAIAWAEDGLDFADALHLAGAQGCDGFASFDKKLVAAAGRIESSPVRAP